MAKLTASQAGSKGGKKILKMYGRQYFSELASKGGMRVAEIYGSQYMANLGRLGNHAKYGNLSKTAERNIRRSNNRILQSV